MFMLIVNHLINTNNWESLPINSATDNNNPMLTILQVSFVGNRSKKNLATKTVPNKISNIKMRKKVV